MEALPKAAASVARVTRARAAFDLKGMVAPMTVLRLRSRDLNMIERQLRNKLTQMPQFFQDAAVALDFSELEGGVGDLPLAALLQALRFLRVVPVGATNVPEADRDTVRAAGLPLLALGAGRPREEAAPSAPAPAATSAHAPAAAPAAAPVPAQARPAAQAAPPAAASKAHLPPVVVRQPVRGGQVIYARNTDLIVLAPVNPGAQIFADGHIHVYSVLRGRAMAGAQGLTEARLFVQKLEAELVAVAGAYVMPDDIPPALRGKAAQVWLDAGECRVSPL
jgi:septum site-determining protein MinC